MKYVIFIRFSVAQTSSFLEEQPGKGHGRRPKRTLQANAILRRINGKARAGLAPLIPTNRCKLTQKASKGQETSERRSGWLGPILHATHRLTRPWPGDGPRAEAQPSVSGRVVRLTSFQESKQA